MLSNALRKLACGVLNVVFTTVVVLSVAGFWAGSQSTAGSADPCQGEPSLYSSDANGDGAIDIGDAVWLLSCLFNGGPPPACLAAGPSPLDDLFVNEGQVDSISTSMISDGTILEEDLAFDVTTHAEAAAYVEPYVPGEIVISAADAELESGDTAWTKVKEIVLPWPGTVRVDFDLTRRGSPGETKGQVRVNDVPAGAEWTTSTDHPDFDSFTDEVTVQRGDRVQLYVSHTLGSGWARYRNFRVKVANPDKAVVLID